MKSLRSTLFFTLFTAITVNAELPRVFMQNAERLAAVKAGASDPAYVYAVELKELTTAADQILKKGTVYTVTATDDLPPSGDIHDYYSLSPYWWPDPSKPDGLPYIRRDGETNPERDRVSDRKPVEAMIHDVGILGQAYYFSGNDAYAAWAAHLLRTWFLDEATKMNPNLNHGQVRKGRNTGTAGAIIGTRRFCLLIDSIGLIEGSPAWSDEDDNALKAWMAEFLDWLLHSEFGKEELKASNNHGTSYDMQVVSIALYLDDQKTAKHILETHTKARIEAQIEPDGAQPEELERTKGWNYCVENIKYFFRLAQMATHVDVDLFHYEASDGGDLKSVIDFLLPYTTKENNWPYLQITTWQPERFEVTLQTAKVVYDDPKIAKALESIGWQKPTLEAFLSLPTGD